MLTYLLFNGFLQGSVCQRRSEIQIEFSIKASHIQLKHKLIRSVKFLIFFFTSLANDYSEKDRRKQAEISVTGFDVFHSNNKCQETRALFFSLYHGKRQKVW